jgi:hypothetical protein
MYMIVEYYRLPDFQFVRQNRKGKPNPSMLYPYRKGCGGFLDLNAGTRPYSNGGKTFCYLIGDGMALVGVATCSMSESFSYKEGKYKALLRATNLGLGHDLDSGIMYRLENWEKKTERDRVFFLNQCLTMYQDKTNSDPNTLYFHPETEKILPEIIGFTIKTSKIILKNHVWIGFEEE